VSSKVIPITAARRRSLSDRKDDELMRLARAGEREAFAALVERHMDRLCDFCVKMTWDRDAGRDIAQEVWIRIWSARDHYAPAGRFESFLFTIARNLCRNARRDRGRRGRVLVDAGRHEEPVDAARGLSSDHVEELLAREQQGRIYEAVSDLPPKFREAILLRFAAGLDYAQMSDVLGRGQSTIRSRVYHGLRRLRHQLAGVVP
jgi:RNA polymerase sigma-70 factor (ECF subfamily)